MAKAFPEVSDETIKSWLATFVAMDKRIWELAEEGGKRNFHRDDFVKTFSLEYPWLNKEGLARAWSRCAYYICHEGYGSYRTERSLP